MIRAYQHLRVHLGISKIHIGIGGSMGGQQLLEWAVEEPELFQNIIPIATNAQHSPWGIAFNATQRFCIEQDSTWPEKTPAAGLEGMKTARAVALLSYRNYHTYSAAQHGPTLLPKMPQSTSRCTMPKPTSGTRAKNWRSGSMRSAIIF
jgi:homoserine O-acetyltransferase